MGGVDLVDRMRSFYPMRARTKKWTVRTIFHFLDLDVVNGWLEYREDHSAASQKKDIMQLYHFKMDVAERLIEASIVDSTSEESDGDYNPSKRGRPVVPLPSQRKRQCSTKHLPIMENLKNYQRCRKEGCKERSRVKCANCEV